MYGRRSCVYGIGGEVGAEVQTLYTDVSDMLM